VKLDQYPGVLNQLSRILRIAHSIGEDDRMAGCTAIVQFAHEREALLNRLRNGRLSVTPVIVDAGLAVTRSVRSLDRATKLRERSARRLTLLCDHGRDHG
jgi:chemotaxis protein histidine kinase CheA